MNTIYRALCRSNVNSEPCFWFQDWVYTTNGGPIYRDFFDTEEELLVALEKPQNKRFLDYGVHVYKTEIAKREVSAEPELIYEMQTMEE